MGLPVNDLGAPSGNSFKFEKLGDTVEGEIVYVGEPQERINKFNGNTERVVKIGLGVDGEEDPVYVWPVVGTQMAQAIAEAVRAAGLSELVEGQKLKLGYVEDKDTGKPQPMKVFKALVTAGASAPAW